MNEIALSAKDFTTDQEVRWCPGCGDYAILKAVRKVLADIGRPPHEVAFVSGIGCAARFPYYLSTYGFHTIHGRAAAVASGLKLARPELDVWVVGGDGDFLSIGGNHTIHVLRRNIDLNLLLFNNAIYGLTKGQYSPTSAIGTRSPSSPEGSADSPINAASLALGSGARFVARSADTLQDHLPEMLKRAQAHKGASFVEIFQNCIVYNDNAFGPITDKTAGPDVVVRAEHGEPLIFGKDREKGLVFDPERNQFKPVVIGDEATRDQIAHHDETSLTLAQALAVMNEPGAPMVLGVLYCAPEATYRERLPENYRAKPLDRSALSDLLLGAAANR